MVRVNEDDTSDPNEIVDVEIKMYLTTDGWNKDKDVDYVCEDIVTDKCITDGGKYKCGTGEGCRKYFDELQ